MEQQQGQLLRLELDRFRDLEPHQLFGVSATASWNEFRQGFLELAKRYHPARLPKGVHPDLLHARMEVFQYLTGEIAKVEKRIQSQGLGAADAQRPLPPARESVLELIRLTEDKMRAVIQVPEGSFALFTSHRVVNLSAGGMFLEACTGMRLGTRLDLLLRFLRRPQREIQTRGVVILENPVATERHPMGVGVKLDGLTDADRSYLKEYVQWAQQPPEQRPTL
jgi:Tfp pilus assembly protein PilZ